ncbi:MAG: PEP/pyruvate-binding domain-containing protein [Chloroflexota bacterium]
MTPSTFIRWFDEINRSDVGDVGGKCASLGELTRMGIRVPPGFAITTAAYARYRETGRLPDEVRDELARAYAELERRCGPGNPVVAVRSSAIGEDAADASFAGQQETFLWRRGMEDVAAHVVRCWDSLFSPQAVAYRVNRVTSSETPQMSVAVQQMVDADVAGVLFTLSPATGDRSVIAINAAWGLGEGVVGGHITPDEYWVDKVSMRLKSRTVVDKPRQVKPDRANGGTANVDVPPEQRAQACLSDLEALELAQLGKVVEQHYGSPQDVEWAIAGGVLYVLQSRPETVWTQRQRSQTQTTTPSAVDFVLRTMGARPPSSSASS